MVAHTARHLWIGSVSLLILLLLGMSGAFRPALAERLTPEQEAAWIESLRDEIAAEGRDFTIRANSLTNIPWEEFRERYLGLELPPGYEAHEIIDDHGVGDRDLPAHWDWREEGGVPGIRHQGACGSCWCFAAAGALEGAMLLGEGFEIDISEQHGLVCNTWGASCSGGWQEAAYELWQTYGAITEEDFPYQADDTVPCPGSTYPPIAMLGTIHDIDYTVSAIKEAIYNYGPVSTTVMVYPDLVPYESGCYSHDCPGELNHAVVLVGWDDSYCDGQGAWIMKNSWGTDWGMDGYAYMRYDAACIGNYSTWVDYSRIADLVGINHTPLGDTEDTAGDYEVFAEIISTGGSIDLGESYMAYRINDGAWVEVGLSAAGGPNEYHAFIPAQPAGTKVEYYLHAEDTLGKTKDLPLWAPEETIVFVVGTFDLILCEDFEAVSGWTVGAAGDDATTGIWEWADPELTTTDDGRYVQSEDDHTPAPGRYCFVTDGRAGSSAGGYDVDGGRTTLLSPSFDLSGYELVVADYRRWYTNRRGAEPNADIWEVSVRSGASGWAAIESTMTCRENWSHQVHILNDVIDFSDDVQFRFIASDEAGGSLVEALLDDFELRGIAGASDVVEGPTPGGPHPPSVALRVYPNPCHRGARIAWGQPVAGPAELQIYDCTGRLLRSLTRAGAGAAQADGLVWQWDGCDQQGHPVATGIYRLRMQAGTLTRQTSLTVVR